MPEGVQCDPIQGQGHQPFKLEILQFANAISSAIYNGSSGNWPLILKLGHNIYILLGWIFDICILVVVFVSRDFEYGRNISCVESTNSPAWG